MLTIPKLIDPLQIALAIGAPPQLVAPVWRTGRLSTRCTGYPQSCQHKLFINNNLRGWIMPAGSSLSGDSAHGKNQGAGFCAGRAPPTARRMRARATESVVDLGRFDNESAWGTAGTERSS